MKIIIEFIGSTAHQCVYQGFSKVKKNVEQ